MATCLAHQLAIMADPGDRQRNRIECRQHVEVEKAVVQRRDQGVGDRMGEPHQVAVVRGRIDHDEVMAILRCGNGSLESGAFGRLVFLHDGAFDACDAEVCRQLQIDLAPPRPTAPALDVVGEGPLPAVEIDGCDALAGLQQRNGDVHRDGGFARAALLVSDHDDMRRRAQLMYGRGKHGCASNRRLLSSLLRRHAVRKAAASPCTARRKLPVRPFVPGTPPGRPCDRAFFRNPLAAQF